MTEREKRRLLPCLMTSAKEYKENLLDTSMLIVYKDRNSKQYKSIEVSFFDRNFMHLTGCEGIGMNAATFLTLCASNRIGVSQFNAISEARLKLEVLPTLCHLSRSAKMMGSYANNRPLLYTEELVGHQAGCLGFVTEQESGYTVPNTVMNEDIRKLALETMQIVAIYQRPCTQTLYPPRPKYICKDLREKVDALVWPEEISRKISQPEAKENGHIGS